MKLVAFFLFAQFLVCTAKGTDKIFIGSTPAAAAVRNFLGIAMSDSIDFIRWKITFGEASYELTCNYGIGKPNTNGFINGGKHIQLKGRLSSEKNIYRLLNEATSLFILNLNNDLIHLLDNNKKFLVGNGGWSYTLNNIAPEHLNSLNIVPSSGVPKDSMVFDGRTPCGVPGIVEEGKLCYKLKWRITLYQKAENSEFGKCRILGTGMRPYGKIGNWTIVYRADRKIFYELTDEYNKPLLHLLKLDDNILLFTDTAGKLLVGNEDFSYTLNRVK